MHVFLKNLFRYSNFCSISLWKTNLGRSGGGRPSHKLVEKKGGKSRLWWMHLRISVLGTLWKLIIETHDQNGSKKKKANSLRSESIKRKRYDLSFCPCISFSLSPNQQLSRQTDQPTGHTPFWMVNHLEENGELNTFKYIKRLYVQWQQPLYLF